MADPIVQEKFCPRCTATKPLAEFNRNRAKADGVNVYCRACNRAYERDKNKNLSEEDRECRRAHQRAYRQRNLEAVRERQRNYMKTDRARAYGRELYAKNAEQERERGRQYRTSEHGKAVRKAYNQRVYKDPSYRQRQRDNRFRREFGITFEQYSAMLAEQNGGCAICGEPPQKQYLSIDHDHATGKVRALLCGTCNRALGLLKDSTELLERAKQYLLAHQPQEKAA